MIHQLIEAYNCDRFSNVESCFEKEIFSALMLKSFLLSLILKYLLIMLIKAYALEKLIVSFNHIPKFQELLARSFD